MEEMPSHFNNVVGGVVCYGYWKEKVKYKTQFCC